MSRLRKAYKSKLEKMPDGGNPPIRVGDYLNKKSQNSTKEEFLKKAKVTPQKETPTSNYSDMLDVAFDAGANAPGLTGMIFSGAGLVNDVAQGDWLGVGLNTANMLTAGLAKGAMSAARVLNNSGARNLARATASTSRSLNRVSNRVNRFTKPIDTGKTLLLNNSNYSAYPKEYKDNTTIRPFLNKPKMPNGGLYPVGDYDRTLAPKKGNYLLPDINRPSYIDDEGGRRSEYKMGVNLDGRETVIPTVVNGRQLSEEEAIDRYQKTGLHMGKFGTPDQSEYASRLRTARYNMLENPVTFNAGMFEKGGKFLPTVIAQKLEHKPSKGLRESYKRRKRI